MTKAGVVNESDGSSLPKWLSSSAVVWMGALLAGGAMLMTAAFLAREQRALEASELQSAALYARVLQDHAERTFDTIDIAMDALADNLATGTRGTDAGHLDEELAHALSGHSFLRSLSLVTAEGRVVASSATGNHGVVVDLNVVRLPAEGANSALGSSVNGRDLADAAADRIGTAQASRTFVPLARPVRNRSGAPLYLVAVINPDFFAGAQELTLADPTRAAGLFSIGGVVFAATTNFRKQPGEDIGSHPFFTRFLPERESGSFVGAGVDGQKAVSAFRVLRKRPAVIVVERSYAHLQTDFRRTLYLALGACICACLVIASTVMMAWRSLRSHEAVSHALERTRKLTAASDHALREMVESVHELIFRADASGKIVFVNRRWQELTRRPAADVLGKRLTDLCRTDEIKACQGLFARPETLEETILVHVDNVVGEALTLDLSVSKLRESDGRTAGFAGFAVDVSAREAAQSALQSQLKFTVQLLEISPTPIFVKDEQGRFLNVNRAWLDLMNLSLPDVLGRSSADLFGHDAAKHQDHDARLLDSEKQISYENRLIVAGRPARDTVVTKLRFTRADGSAAGIVGSIFDVTEFREAERDIRRARDAAQLANKTRSDFIANISHELRTPLQGIMGFSEIGRDLSETHPDFLDLFSDIHAGGQRMLSLVNGLLDVSQIDSAFGSLPLQRVDIAQIVREAADQLQSNAIVRDLKLHLHGLDQILEGDADRARLQQAVRNVLANAIKFSPVGESIDVSLTNAGQAGIQVRIRDRGPGIPDQELELIFDPFVQSSRTRDGAGGTGLGLAIARKIMGAHGGSIVAANCSDGGTLVSLSIPSPGPAQPVRSDAGWRHSDRQQCVAEVR